MGQTYPMEQAYQEKRITAAIEHRPIYPVSCAPLIECYAARYANVSTFDFLNNRDLYQRIFKMLRADYRVFNIRRSLYFLHHAPYQNIIGLMKMKIPAAMYGKGGKFSEFQFIEDEYMQQKDYAIILQHSYRQYLLEFYKRTYAASEEDVLKAERQMLNMHKKEVASAQECGQTFLYGAHLYFPASHFSNLRKFSNFIHDLYSDPDQMAECVMIGTRELTEGCLKTAEETGIPRIMIGPPRLSGEFFSNKIFEKVFWPSLSWSAKKIIAKGVTPVFHLDGNWIRNLEYFKELPPKKVIIELDSYTDIFHAKKILGGHTCLCGDVPAKLFTFGNTEDMERYCFKLIDTIGADGGFILGSGCTLPVTARHENVSAFMNSIPKYYFQLA